MDEPKELQIPEIEAYCSYHTDIRLNSNTEYIVNYISDQYGIEYAKVYYDKNCKRNRENDKPSAEVYSSTGKLIKEIWYKDSCVHRDYNLGPAIVKYDKEGNVTEKIYYQNGIVSNPHGPAQIIFREGVVKKVAYKINGKYHRDNYPAYYDFDRSEIFKYFSNDELHREDGPAIYHKRVPYRNKYYFNGVHLTEFILEIKKKNNISFVKRKKANLKLWSIACKIYLKQQKKPSQSDLDVIDYLDSKIFLNILSGK